MHAAYNSGKAGLQALANMLRLEVQGLGVDIGVAHNIYTATQTGREAVEHALIRQLLGRPKMKPQTVGKTAAMLVLGIEQRSRTIIVAAARLALLSPDTCQLAGNSSTRRNRWAYA